MREPGYGRALRDYRLNGEADIATIAVLIGDEARASMLVGLLSSTRLSMSALAERARIGLPAASKHLARLEGGGLVRSERQGRQRMYQLASDSVAQALEALATIAPVRPTRTLSERTRLDALRAARTCYDHLAGRLGVGLFQALVDRAALAPIEASRLGVQRKVRCGLGPVALGPSAEDVFSRVGVDLDGSRTAAMACLDWTEDRPHLSGPLGSRLYEALLERGWVQTRPQARAVRLTPDGQAGLQATLGLEVEPR